MKETKEACECGSDTQTPGPDARLPEQTDESKLSRELAGVLNKYNAENATNTPDFILAEYLLACLKAWNKAFESRCKWYEVPHP